MTAALWSLTPLIVFLVALTAVCVVADRRWGR